MRFCSDSVGSTSHDDGRLLTLLPAASSSTRQVDPFLSLPPDVHSCILATGLDAASLSRLEASCRHFMIAIGDSASVWLTVGRQMFFGVEVDQGRDFSAFQATDGLDGEAAHGSVVSRKWKTRFRAFLERATSFNNARSEFPFPRCHFRMDLLEARPSHGLYFEIETRGSVSGLLFGISGGSMDMNSFTFYPAKGQIREISLLPDVGMFSNFRARADNVLAPVDGNEGFHGAIGFYLSSAQIAFFRRKRVDTCYKTPGDDQAVLEETRPQTQDLEVGPEVNLLWDVWETTGFVPMPSWTSRERLNTHVGSSALAGGHSIRVTRLGVVPPLWPI